MNILDRLLKNRYYISIVYIIITLFLLDRLALSKEWVVTLLYVLAIYGFLLLIAFEPKRYIDEVGTRPNMPIVPIAISLLAFSYCCIILQTEVLGWSWLVEDGSNLKYSNIPYFISDVFLFIIIAPIVEEIFFRQWLYEKLKNRMKPLFSIIVVALIFGIVHIDLIGSFVFSMVLSFYYISSISIANNIFIHATFNGFLVVFQFFIDNEIIGDLDTLASVYLSENIAVLMMLIVTSSISIYWLTTRYIRSLEEV
ncbi:CPBP family intramembrane glutamic endopeptidase [Reinekea marina]|uniref:CPBP family intramembrane glutamic endopeptidase n=1 Tax=Reinekea marina TaxID=1310421 RepID=A0ABV7WV43_9GAMM